MLYSPAPDIAASEILCKYSSVNSPEGSFTILNTCLALLNLGVTFTLPGVPVALNLPDGNAQLVNLDFCNAPCTVGACKPAFKVALRTPLIAELA